MKTNVTYVYMIVWKDFDVLGVEKTRARAHHIRVVTQYPLAFEKPYDTEDEAWIVVHELALNYDLRVDYRSRGVLR